MSLSRGQRLGPYEILAPLGGGGMGEVYRAHDARLARDIALKILPADVASDAERLERFRREARAVAALNHPHIVTIFSIEEDGGVPFMTMELIEGQSLDRQVGGGLPLGQFFDIALALADALSAAHRRGLVHRDIKPANVMVTDAGVVKVLDFGLARETEAAGADGATMLGLTQAGIIVGTVPYMSPEQIEAKPIDHRSDIFSAGVVFYEMLSGVRPFGGDSSPALMSSILKDRPRPLTAVRRDVPEQLWQVIAHCLEKSSTDRLQSAQELHAALKALRRAWESGTVTLPSAVSAARAKSSDLRVAVLPFVSRGGGDAEALAEGLTDDITAGLSRFQHLRVVSRAEAEKAKGHSADARAAGAVGARFLIDGAVRTSGTAVRVTVRLVDTASRTHIWAENYDRTLSSDTLFTVQDDLAGRIIATAGDSVGVLVRAMAAILKDRDVDELSVDELVIRFYLYIQSFRADEHLRLRTAFEQALEREPTNALGWAILAQLYENEHSQQLNPLPQPLARSARAAERAVEIDPTCGNGWLVLSVLHFFNRDVNALRMAGERTVALNPFDAASTAYIGMMRAYAGDWEEGLALTRRAMDLNPHHPGWLHYVLATDYYRRGDYEQTLLEGQRSNMPQFIWTHLCVIIAAGQLGRVEDARGGFDGLRKIDPRFLEADVVRHVWSQWTPDRQLLDRFMDGFAKAKALLDRPGPVSSLSPGPWPLVADRSASIAVMPFNDLSPARDQEWFCDGIAEEILNALTPLKNLRVAAKASAFSLRGKSNDLKSIGEKLNVSTVLSGSVRRAGERVRITVQLSEVATGFQLWSDRYDRELRDIFDVQDEIANAVADRLKVSLDDDPLSRLARLVERGTTDVEAYQRYLQGRALLSRRGGHIARAIELFREAVALDPDYALAWAGIAEAHCMLVYYGLARGSDAKAAAVAAATRAVELEPSSAPAHASLAFAVLLFDQDLDRAGREFERAIDLNPRDVHGRCWYALFYLQWTRGRFAEGVAHARRALEDDPLSAYPALMLGGCLQATGALEEAMATGRLAVERDPDSIAARWVLGATLALAGRVEQAFTIFTAAAAMTDSPVALSGLAFAYAQAGRPDEAAHVYDQLKSLADKRYVPLAFLVSAATSSGRLDEAVALARRAWDDREPIFMLWARHYHEYSRLRGDPRFQEILQEIDAASA